MSVLQLEHVGYRYDKANRDVLNDVNYEFEAGKVYAIVGKSGAGKTTLLSLLSALTSPTSGTIRYNDADIKSIDRYDYRCQCVGVIFQSFNLLPHLTALENVVLSMDISHKQIADKKDKAMELLEKVHIQGDKVNRKILKLSGGEQQRVAIARALSYNPQVILADEPTGNLDQGTQQEVMDIFRSLAYEDKKCVIIVTHSPQVANMSDEVYHLDTLR